MPTAEKAAIIAETAALLKDAQAVVLARYSQLSVADMNDIRRDLGQNGVTVKVVKNTLIKRAADAVGIEGLEPYLEGPTVLLASVSDPVAPARMAQQKARTYRTLEVKAGVLGQRVLGPSEVQALAALPSREQLLAQVVGTLAAPIQRLVWVLDAPLANLARVLDQVRQQRAAQAS
jgi:large subunit ribosomal protein L10